jgi:hypothetical protein
MAVPTFTSHRSAGVVPSFSPAASPWVRRRPFPWPPGRRNSTVTGVVRSRYQGGTRTAVRPISTRLEPAVSLEGVLPLVHVVLHLPALLAGPEPSGSAGPARRCRGCSRPALRLQGQAASSFSGLLRQTAGGLLLPTRY